MKTFAGIGSRTIDISEKELILKIGTWLFDDGWICFSGNADGSDITFQIASLQNCVIWLPWPNFNKNNYNPTNSIACFDMGKSPLGESYLRLHPNVENLTYGAKSMMRRNAHQILGYGDYSKVRFVVCCSNYTKDKTGVWGGTGHAIRIAKEHNIPWFNIRGASFNEFTDWYSKNKLNEYQD